MAFHGGIAWGCCMGDEDYIHLIQGKAKMAPPHTFRWRSMLSVIRPYMTNASIAHLHVAMSQYEDTMAKVYVSRAVLLGQTIQMYCKTGF